MKGLRLFLPVLIMFCIISCRYKKQESGIEDFNIPVDKGFSEFISAYTSGVLSVNSVVEIHFTPQFAALIDKKKIPAKLFDLNPSVKGRSEWDGENTIIFRPSGMLSPGTTYKGVFHLHKLADVNERLKDFPIRIRTLKKDFIVKTGLLECQEEDNSYTLHGELIASDYIPSSEVEASLGAKLGKSKTTVYWDHSDMLIHRFRIPGIKRTEKTRILELLWDGSTAGIRRKGSANVNIPGSDEFSVIDFRPYYHGAGKIDIVFSDPVDISAETEGLIWTDPPVDLTAGINSNIVSLYPSARFEGEITFNIEKSIKNKKGRTLTSSFSTGLDFSPPVPAIELTGNGVIVPSSTNLVFPFKAFNLRAVDLKIIKIFENNLPYFLQEFEINGGYHLKRFGRPVYSGRIDLVTTSGSDSSSWDIHTIDLSEYTDIEPGVLYRVELGMRPSYSLYPCNGEEHHGRLEEALLQQEELNRNIWDDPDTYYDDNEDFIYYSLGLDWRERDNPCNDAYFSPDKKVSRNILASNLGIMAKKGENDNLRIAISNLLTAMPVSDASIEVFDYQMQMIASGNTDQNGNVSLQCERRPFLLTARKDKDRNYLKLTDGTALSMSSFDVSGNKPENGISAFIYGERDVWRPGDSVYLSMFIRDPDNNLPAGHPVQFEFYNPLGQIVDNQVQILRRGKLLSFRTTTSSDAITGNYQANFKIGGAIFSKRVRIETIKPNRLKVNLDFTAGPLLRAKTVTRGILNVKWLNGATARNLKSSVEYIFKKTKTEFDNFRQYSFDDPAIDFYSETVNMFDGYVDEKGTASISFDPAKEINAPGMLNTIFTVKVSERGGDESITQITYKFAPYPVFVGINFPGLQDPEKTLFTDKDNEIRVVTVDPDGKPVQTEVELTIYKISYRWWWESDQENLAAYISNNIYKPLISKKINTPDGKGSFSFNIPKDQWGRYLVRVTSAGGHSSGKIVLVDWPWEYGMKSKAEGATLLTVSTDKEKYNPGDEVSISFPSPENARAVVTLENATSIIDEIQTTTVKGTTVVSFRAKPEMAPNVYAYVTIIQPHAQTINDMPIRLYGVVPVMVEDPDTRLNPRISMADQVRSNERIEIQITEAERKPMMYTLALVDEGLLDITGYKTPDPWNYFYSREALGVRTWDLYDFVLGAFGGTLERIFATGGDESMIDQSANKAQRFPPVVRFMGPFTLTPGKTASHTVTIPLYNGSLKAMVIAGNDRAFGCTEKNVLIKDPLMILATAPRIFSPGEKISLPVTLFVQKDDIKSVIIKVEGNNLISFDENQKTVLTAGNGESESEFTFTTGEKTGIATIKISASGGGETAFYELEAEVRNPNPPETRTMLKVLSKGQKWTTSFVPFGSEGSNSATLQVSSLPSVNLEKRLGYLLDYPHGCTEQIISSAFPLLWIADLTGNDVRIAESATQNIKDVINKIISRQMNDGGIAQWPGSYQPDNWVTSYSGHFMAEAEKLGYVIPSGFKQKWISYQRRKANDWGFDKNFRQSANDQAYRLFTLALSGTPEKGAMNRLRETENIPSLSGWLLAAAFVTTGRKEVADDLLDLRNTQTEEEFAGYYYGSRLRDKAVILYTLSLLKKEEEALPLLKDICSELENNDRYSTHTTAWCLFSYIKFTEMISGEATGEAKIRITLNDEKSENNLNEKQVLLKDLKIIEESNTLIVENISDVPLYINLAMKGIPSVRDAVKEEKGLTMKTDYLDFKMQSVDQQNMEQGSDFMMIVRVTNTTFRALENIALTQMVASGWEIQNTRLFEANYGIRESSFDYRDFRDDRVYTYFGLKQGETKTFVMIINAAYKGEFFQPSLWCEAMYNENCYSRLPGNVVRVNPGKIE